MGIAKCAERRREQTPQKGQGKNPAQLHHWRCFSSLGNICFCYCSIMASAFVDALSSPSCCLMRCLYVCLLLSLYSCSSMQSPSLSDDILCFTCQYTRTFDMLDILDPGILNVCISPMNLVWLSRYTESWKTRVQVESVSFSPSTHPSIVTLMSLLPLPKLCTHP